MTSPGLTLTIDERRLLDCAACWPGAALADLTAAELSQLAATEGLDFATALLYDRLCRSPVHAPYLDQLDAVTEPRLTEPGVAVTIVPGAFYTEDSSSGADGRLIREEAARFGCPTALIPLPSFGALAECGRLICAALLRHKGPPVVLVSLSKGGADVRAALARTEAGEAFDRVAAWVSLSGIISGTPLVDWLRRRRLRTLLVRSLFWLRGYPFDVLRELDRKPDDPPALRLPSHMQVIHVTGFPLRQHLSDPRLRRGYRRLAPLGPNDGVALLADVCQLPGVVCPVWGADHYLRLGGPGLRGLFARILCLVTAGRECHGPRLVS